MIQKYGAALTSILLAAFVFLKIAAANGVDVAEVAQLVAIVAGAVAIYLVPLVKGPWVGALKTGMAVVVAAATALAPFLLTGHLTLEQITVVAIAALNALGVEIGVQARKSVIDAGTYDPEQGAVITSLDPQGEKALGKEPYAYIAADDELDLSTVDDPSALAAAAVGEANRRVGSQR